MPSGRPLDSARHANPISRRRALQRVGGAAGTAAAIGLWPAIGRGAEEASETKIRVGIVGGRFGATFQWHQHPNCIVQAVSDLRPERRQRLMQVYQCERSYESLEKMILDDSIDAIAIYTEAPNHVPHCLKALNAGKHVLCAVPAAMDLEECQTLIDAVNASGLSYMMAETSYWQQPTISARKFYQEGLYGNLYNVYSAYRHAGLETLAFENGKRTWRHGFPPMHYPTHCTAHLIGVTGDRLTEVTCIGWGDNDPMLKDNAYDNPFWTETALFKTEAGRSCNIELWWGGAHRGCERAEWYGDKMSFLSADAYGRGPVLVHAGSQKELDSGGFTRSAPRVEPYDQPQWWNTPMLPEPLRNDSGHHGSHTFIVHEFIESLVQRRRPAVDVYEAVAYTAPGIIAHQSALKGGENLPIPDFGRAVSPAGR